MTVGESLCLHPSDHLQELGQFGSSVNQTWHQNQRIDLWSQSLPCLRTRWYIYIYIQIIQYTSVYTAHTLSTKCMYEYQAEPHPVPRSDLAQWLGGEGTSRALALHEPNLTVEIVPVPGDGDGWRVVNSGWVPAESQNDKIALVHSWFIVGLWICSDDIMMRRMVVWDVLWLYSEKLIESILLV